MFREHLVVFGPSFYADGVVVPEEHSPESRGRKKKGFMMKQMVKVKKTEEGKLSPALRLRKRVGSFTTGVAVGSENFVRGFAARYQEVFGRQNVRSGRLFFEGDRDHPKKRRRRGQTEGKRETDVTSKEVFIFRE